MDLRFPSHPSVTYLAGFAVSMAIFSAILFSFGYNPALSIRTIASGSFGTAFNATSTLVLTVPFLLAALSFLVPFKARFYNVGVEGQIYIGALTAYLMASGMRDFPNLIAVFLVAAAGFLGGTLWLALPLFMKVKLQVNELFPTLVLNFVALDLVNWLTSGPIKDPRSINPQTPVVPHSTWLPIILPGTPLDAGIIIAILAAIVVYLVLQKTVLGYEIRASGANPRAAAAGGVSIVRSTLVVGLLSGGLAGLAGMVIVTTGNHWLVQNFSPGYGYMGIGVAALANFNPIGTVFAAVLYSALWVGGQALEVLPGAEAVPIYFIYILQATVVLVVLMVQKLLLERRTD